MKKYKIVSRIPVSAHKQACEFLAYLYQSTYCYEPYGVKTVGWYDTYRAYFYQSPVWVQKEISLYRN